MSVLGELEKMTIQKWFEKDSFAIEEVKRHANNAVT